MKEVLGSKGAGLAEMTNAGLPVPPGFTIATSACRLYFEGRNKMPEAIAKEYPPALDKLESLSGLKLGDPKAPLLVSVRSGAKFSMPGMMDTILNLGMNDETVEALSLLSGDPRFAYDSYRRFITMYSDVVLGVGHDHFEEILEEYKESKGYVLDTD